MNTYQSLQRKVLGLAFVLGPLLLTVGAVIYLLGIERSPDGTNSWVEGIFMAFGALIMVPVYFELARILGQRAPISFYLGNDGREIFAWWVVNLLYALGCLAWLAALAPIGLRYLAGDSQAYELEPASSTLTTISSTG